MTTTKRRDPTTVVRVVVALVGVGCLLFTAQGAVKAADRGVTLMSDRQHDLRAFRHHVDYETAWRQFAARVPSGSRVALTPARSNQELWHQRLTEFAALHGCVIVQGTTPDYVVGVALVKRKRPAAPGVRLDVRKVG